MHVDFGLAMDSFHLPPRAILLMSPNGLVVAVHSLFPISELFPEAHYDFFGDWDKTQEIALPCPARNSSCCYPNLRIGRPTALRCEPLVTSRLCAESLRGCAVFVQRQV
jgi:hypothetical protein